jgi:dihydropteroate synthase
MHYSVRHRVVPKRLEPNLVCLRDIRIFEQGDEQLVALAGEIRDHNVRVFAERGEIHALCDGVHLKNADPFVVFQELLSRFTDRIDPSHAFYLGYEMNKAVTALTLGKQYRQDEALDWGYLTVPEVSHRAQRRSDP